LGNPRRGTETRQRTVQIGLRLTPEESMDLWDRASRRGMNIQQYLLSLAFPEPEKNALSDDQVADML
jgi:predicted DNA binding CopG/RHH family protein